MTKTIEGVNSPQERERPNQEYIDGIAKFEELLNEMRGRFFPAAGAIKKIKEQIFFLKDYIGNEPT